MAGWLGIDMVVFYCYWLAALLLTFPGSCMHVGGWVAPSLPPPSLLRTKRGESVEAGLVFQCTGPRPATHDFRDGTSQYWGWQQQGGGEGLPVRATLEVQQQQQGGGVLVLGAGDVVSMEGGGGDWTALSAELQAEAAAMAVIRAVAHARQQQQQQQQPQPSPPPPVLLPAYPRCMTGCDSAPLIYAISLGPHHALLVFNSLLLLGSGPIGGRVAALAKAFIEKSKLLEVQQWAPAMWLWERLAHPLTFFLHRLMVLLALVPVAPPARDQSSSSSPTTSPGVDGMTARSKSTHQRVAARTQRT